MIKLSASLIKDVLACSQRGYYRIKKPELAEQTTKMMIGDIVHKIIEVNWMDYNQAVLDASIKCVGLDEDIYNSVLKYLDNFFKNFYGIVSPDDKVEEFFKFNLYEDVYFVGKLDRVNPRLGILLDWKTSDLTPKTIDNDIQFISYYYAFKRLYKHEPSLVGYASLSKGVLVKYNFNEFYFKNFTEKIIPNVVNIIRSGLYVREGVFDLPGFKSPLLSSTCTNCSFKNHCWEWED